MRKTMLALMLLVLVIAWPMLAPEMRADHHPAIGEIPANVKIIKHTVKDGEKLLGLAYRYKWKYNSQQPPQTIANAAAIASGIDKDSELIGGQIITLIIKAGAEK